MRFKKMNTSNPLPWRGVGVGQYKNIIHFFESPDIIDKY